MKIKAASKAPVPLYRRKALRRKTPLRRAKVAEDASVLVQEDTTEYAGRLRFLDFFAGSGLVTEALRNEFRAVWANDNSRKKAEVYRINHGSNHFDGRSIEEVGGDDVPDAAVSWASFPCQDLSLAGNLDGIHGERSGMIWHWLRVMREMGDRRPPIVAIENVAGLVSAKQGEYYRKLHRALGALGYKAGAVLLDAVAWIPQSRPRVFVVGVPKDMPAEAFADSGPNWLHPESVRAARRGLTDWVWWKLPKPTPRQVNLEDIIEWDAEHHDEARSKRHLALIADKHQTQLLKELANGFRVAPGYRRTRERQVLELRFDGIAGCLRTPEGGSSRQYLVLKKEGRLVTRLITIREAARLMGAPDSYRLPAGYNDAYAALGDAVAVPPVRYLGEHLLAPLARLAMKVTA